MMKNSTVLLMISALLLGTILTCSAAEFTGGPIAADKLRDGIYIGEAKDGPAKVVAEVRIQNQRVVQIKLLEHHNWKGIKTDPVIPERIIAEQSTKVDAMSGATYSSRAIMRAVEDALSKARK